MYLRIPKILAAVLASAILTIIVPFEAFAGNDITPSTSTICSGDCGEQGSNVIWSLDIDTGVLSITGTGRMADYESSDAEPWSDFDNVQTVTIEAGVTNVGQCAFMDCTDLTEVTIASSVTSIDDSAFRGCSSLTRITLSSGVTSIGESAFRNCSSLESITIPSGVTSIGDNVFLNCSGLKNVTIPSGVTAIGANAFHGCSSLESIELPSGVTSIGESAFAWCRGLRSLEIPLGVTSIEAQTFYYCSSLEGITIPSGVTSIGTEAFYWCTSLKKAVILSDTAEIGASAFWACSGLESVVLSSGVTSIGKNAFYACTGLANVYYAGTQTQWNAISIGSSNSSLTGAAITYNYEQPVSITLQPQSVTVGAGTTVQFTVGALGIGLAYQWQVSSDNGSSWSSSTASGSNTAALSVSTAMAQNGYLYRCLVSSGSNTVTSDAATLKVVAILITAQPENADVSAGTAVEFNVAAAGIGLTYQWQLSKNSGKSWVNSTASGAKTNTVTIKTVPAVDGYLYRCVITDSSGNTATSESVTLTLNSVSGTCGADLTWKFYPGAGALYINGTGKMDDYVGYDRPWRPYIDSVTSISIGSGVTSIGNYAFYNCSRVESVTIPSGVTTIGVAAFCDCSGLKSVTIPSSVKTIGNAAFCRCSSLESVEIPSGVKTIGENVFESCSGLKSVTIPSSVTSIGSNAFCDCSSLTDVYYRGSEEQWNAIDVSLGDSDLFTSGTEIHYNDISITAQPQNVSAVDGTKPTMSVTAVGDNLTYCWQIYSTSSKKWVSTTTSGCKTDTITISAVTSRDGYRYRCVITDATGNSVTSNAATLRVLGVTAQPQSTAAVVGSAVKFTVTVTGNVKSYQWQYRSTTGTSWKNTTLTGCKTASLTVKATAGRDGYRYRCVITDASGNTVTSTAATLRVLGVTGQPQSAAVSADSTARFKVTVTGDVKSYQWQYRSATGTGWKNTTLTGCKTASLTVKATTGRDGYRYRCVITDTSGNTVTSTAATLRVLGVTAQPKSTTVSVGSTAQFKVTVTGDVKSYQWQYRSATGTSWKNTTLTGCKTASLSVKATTGRNGYRYRCVIKDTAGNTVTSNAATLTVK